MNFVHRGGRSPPPAFLQTWFDGESLFSWAARFHFLQGRTSCPRTKEYLFGAADTCFRYGSPVGIAHFVELTKGKLGSVEEIFLKRTRSIEVRPFLSGALWGEAQQENLAVSQFARDFLTFFLRLLNHGIPVVIIGNPMAFSEYGDFRIGPAYDFRDEEWRGEWMPDLWMATLLDEEDEPIEDLDELIWTYTAGFPRYVALLRRETLSVAIQMGSTKVCLDHIEIAKMSPPMMGAAKLISAFVNRDWRDLEQFLDIPIAEIRLRWSLMAPTQPTDSDSSAADKQTGIDAASADGLNEAPVKKPKPKKVPSKRKTPKLSKSVRPSQEFGPDDIRSQEYLKKLNRPPK